MKIPFNILLVSICVCISISACKKQQADDLPNADYFNATVLSPDLSCSVWLLKFEDNLQKAESRLGRSYQYSYAAVNLPDSLKLTGTHLRVTIRKPLENETQFVCNAMGIPPVFVYLTGLEKLP